MNVQSNSGGVVEIGNQMRLECHYLLSPDESVFSILWLWSDSRYRDDSFVANEVVVPNETVDKETDKAKRNGFVRIPFYRYRPVDPDENQRKKAWFHQIRGKFTVDVRNLYVASTLIIITGLSDLQSVS